MQGAMPAQGVTRPAPATTPQLCRRPPPSSSLLLRGARRPMPARRSSSGNNSGSGSGGGSAMHHGACPTNAPENQPDADAAAPADGGSNDSNPRSSQSNVFLYGSLDSYDDDGVDDSSAAFWHRPRAPPSFHLRHNGLDHDVVKTWDRDKEAGRVQRRQLFSFIDWKRHRSSYRYVHQLETLLTSRVLRGLLWPVMLFSSLAAGVVAWQSLAAAAASGALLAAAPSWLAPHYVPASLPALPAIPLEIFSLVSFAMALLLGSRISTSYGRWNEARQSFGRITTTARNMFRQSLALLPPEATGARALMCRWLIAYVRCAKWYLREDEPLRQELEPWLTRAELRALLRSPHPPNYCLAVLSRVLASTPGLDPYALVRLEEGLSDMMRGLSACDRILNTPAPLMFSRHATRLLTLFLVLLPLGLYPAMGVGTVFAEAIVAFALTGIEEVGISIEEPLSILPLEKLCVKAERQIADMLRIDAAVLAYVSREQTLRGAAGGSSPPQPLEAYGDEGPLREDYGGPSMASALRERAAMLKAATLAATVVSSSPRRAGRARPRPAPRRGPAAMERRRRREQRRKQREQKQEEEEEERQPHHRPQRRCSATSGRPPRAWTRTTS